VVRRREIVVRAALGGGRGRLICQTLTESTLLAVMGGAAGVLLAKIGTNLLVTAKPVAFAHLNEISMDYRALLFGLGVSILSGLVFGAAPAWSASRTDIADGLKRDDRTATESRRGMSFRKILVAGQLALAVILLTGAGLLLKSFARLRFVDPGFNPENLTIVPVTLPAARYDAIAKQTRFRREVLERLNALPGVEAAMAGDVPLDGNEVVHRLILEGGRPTPVGEELEADTFCVMGDYFRVMQTPLRAGRALNDSDREDHPLAAVVNEALVRTYFGGQNPVGMRIRWARDADRGRWMTVVGVVADVKQDSLAEPAFPTVYTPFVQSDEAWRRWMSIVVRSERKPATLVPEVKRQIWSVDSGIPLDHIGSMEAALGLSLSERRFNTALLSLFAGLAVALAAVGVYSVMAYSVSQRTHEIGIRMAVGARHGDLVRLVVAQGARLAAIGLIAGLAGAFALTRLMTRLLFEVAPSDPLTMAAAALFMISLALLACYIPARRAARVDPMAALRCD
jgi:putative ABC transport system permease protein